MLGWCSLPLLDPVGASYGHRQRCWRGVNLCFVFISGIRDTATILRHKDNNAHRTRCFRAEYKTTDSELLPCFCDTSAGALRQSAPFWTTNFFKKINTSLPSPLLSPSIFHFP